MKKTLGITTGIAALVVSIGLATSPALAQDKVDCSEGVNGMADFIKEFPHEGIYKITMARHDDDFLECWEREIPQATEGRYRFHTEPIEDLGVYQGEAMKRYVVYPIENE